MGTGQTSHSDWRENGQQGEWDWVCIYYIELKVPVVKMWSLAIAAAYNYTHTYCASLPHLCSVKACKETINILLAYSEYMLDFSLYNYTSCMCTALPWDMIKNEVYIRSSNSPMVRSQWTSECNIHILQHSAALLLPHFLLSNTSVTCNS